MSQTVVILGASYAGITIAHKLLKITKLAVPGLKVILVNPSTHFYWNLASVRAIVPGLIKDDELFQDIAQGFQYAGASFEFVLGSAESLDIEKKSVSISTPNGVRNLIYDKLVLSTGSRTDGKAPWKAVGAYEEMLDELHAVQSKVASAKSIVIGGAGPTGVEIAGELGCEYNGKKEVTLVCILYCST